MVGTGLFASDPPLEGLQRALPARQLFSAVRDRPLLFVGDYKNKAARIAPGRLLVGAGGLEPPTPTVSRWCSTAELRANTNSYFT